MEGDSLIECPVSNSWSFLVSVPNMATGVEYQDDETVYNNEEENGGRVSTVCLIMSLIYIYQRCYMYLIVHLLHDQVSNSWSLPTMPNKAASVGYQDDVVMIDEEEDQDVGVSAVVLCILFNCQ